MYQGQGSRKDECLSCVFLLLIPASMKTYPGKSIQKVQQTEMLKFGSFSAYHTPGSEN